jgi:hypothetical protein
MPLVELLGPPAVGKSTLQEALVVHGMRDAGRAVLVPRWRSFAPLAGVARCARPRWHALADRVLLPPGPDRIEAALSEVAPRWAPFLDLILEGPPQSVTPSPDASVLGIVERLWLLEALERRALLEALPPTEEPLILDEGLTHPYKALAVAGRDERRLHRYAALVPIPDVLVAIDAESDLIAARLADRYRRSPTRIRAASVGTSDAAIREEVSRVRHAVDVVVAAAETRGCTVVRFPLKGERADVLADRLLTRLADEGIGATT